MTGHDCMSGIRTHVSILYISIVLWGKIALAMGRLSVNGELDLMQQLINTIIAQCISH
jgi:hypothetical protein